MERINKAWKSLLIQQDPSLKEVFDQHPAWQPVRNTPFQLPQLNQDGGPPNTWQLVADWLGLRAASIRQACRQTTAAA